MALTAATNHNFQASGMGRYLLALLPFRHPDKISAPIASTPSAAPNGLSFNSVLTVDIKHRCWSGLGLAGAGQSAVFLAAMKLTAIRLTFG
jgi:hypothetical protein